jgi:hypothetical protein
MGADDDGELSQRLVCASTIFSEFLKDQQCEVKCETQQQQVTTLTSQLVTLSHSDDFLTPTTPHELSPFSNEGVYAGGLACEGTIFFSTPPPLLVRGLFFFCVLQHKKKPGIQLHVVIWCVHPCRPRGATWLL